MKYGFDNEKYLRIQSEQIKERIGKFGNKLYLEFGGKLFDDYHASRVLPGFEPDSKLKMLTQLKDDAEIVIVISAVDIEKNKKRGDLGITYDEDVLRLREAFTERGFEVSGVVITHYSGQGSARAYHERLERMGIKAYYHYMIEGYPTNVELIDSDEGFGRNDYVETTRPLVVITAPGPGSGKMAVCLSQLYQENKRGIKAGYAKFETFPIWSIALKHPVNIAYEAATADLNDVNMIDPFHLEAYGETAVNYNRDIEIFPVLNAIFERIYGEGEAKGSEGSPKGNPYKSPTDMGVNMAGFCISDDEVCRQASKDEIIRRYYTALCDYANGKGSDSEVNKIALLMKQANISTDDRRTTVAAKERLEIENSKLKNENRADAANTNAITQSRKNAISAAAIELGDGTIITASSSDLLGACAALMLNALKHLAGIDHSVKLIAQKMIEPIQHTKVNMLHGSNPRLHTDEVLVTLSILSLLDDNCRRALDCLPMLDGCQMHTTVMTSEVDRKIFKKLGVGLTSEPIRKD